MAKGISGTALAAAAAGALLLWSGIKGRSWSMVVRELIGGEAPKDSQENPITIESSGSTSDGSTSPGATTANLSGNKKIVNMVASTYGWGSGAEWDALVWVINHESGFRNTAQNPTSSAYGMFQFLDGTWASVGGKKTSDPTTQAQLGMKYIKSRYGDPIKAKSFWQSHNWY
jgi:hypothetical protein